MIWQLVTDGMIIESFPHIDECLSALRAWALLAPQSTCTSAVALVV